MDNKIIKSILPTIFALMVLAIIGNSIQNIALAQSNSNETSVNQTGAEIIGKPETTIINKTTIPAQQTTVTVNKTTSSLDQSALQPLQNQTMAEAPADLSAFKNKTVLQPTGEAQTTMVNKTTVPFEQTTVEGINQTQGQQQQDNQTIIHKDNNNKIIKQLHKDNNKEDKNNNNKNKVIRVLVH